MRAQNHEQGRGRPHEYSVDDDSFSFCHENTRHSTEQWLAQGIGAFSKISPFLFSSYALFPAIAMVLPLLPCHPSTPLCLFICFYTARHGACIHRGFAWGGYSQALRSTETSLSRDEKLYILGGYFVPLGGISEGIPFQLHKQARWRAESGVRRRSIAICIAVLQQPALGGNRVPFGRPCILGLADLPSLVVCIPI